jgi:hypothetical protein
MKAPLEWDDPFFCIFLDEGHNYLALFFTDFEEFKGFFRSFVIFTNLRNFWNFLKFQELFGKILGVLE